jgi:Uma2 family endonuclease
MATATITPDGSEIILREAKPAFEWILGRAMRKMSPRTRHSLVQGRLAGWLLAWAGERGLVGTEWRCRLAPWGEIRRPLVPDVAYLSNERFATLTTELDREEPPFAQDIVVEVLSPGDRMVNVMHKRDVYLATGARLVMLVDPRARNITSFDDAGGERCFECGETFTADAFPGLAIALDDLFARLD